MSAAARERARDYTWERYGERLVANLEERRLALTFAVMITTHDRCADLRRTCTALCALCRRPRRS